MERQQLLKAADKGVIFSEKRYAMEAREPLAAEPLARPKAKSRQDEGRGLMGAIGDLFGRKARTTYVCDVIIASFVVLNCITLLGASPVIFEKQLSTYNLIPSGRNIRHLPCISRRTKEEGTCMFAIDCLKANGTHLGTCIDRFYFGSCCQMPDYEDLGNENSIEDNSISEKPTKEGDVVLSTTISQRPKLPSASTAGSTHYITRKPVIPVSSTTRRPQNKITNKYTTEKPISAQTDSKYSTKTPATPPVIRTEDKDNQLGASVKPSRQNTTAQTTNKPTYLSSRPTENPIQSTASTIRTTIYINNQQYNASKPVVTSKKPITTEATTEMPLKLTTFQSVNVQKTTQKPSTLNDLKKPSQKPDSSLPFGTRLPSTTPFPSSTVKQTTLSPQTTLGQTSATNATLSLSSQKPIRPTAAQRPKPDRPSPKPTVVSTKATPRPTVQRPINSTLSNRRTTTTRPTTIVKKPTVQTETTTKKTTTVVYKPFSSLSPTNTSQSSKPTRLSTTTQKTTTTTIKIDKTTVAPTKVTATTKRPTETVTVVKRPVTNATKITSTTAKPTKPVSTYAKPAANSTVAINNVTSPTTPSAPLKINYNLTTGGSVSSIKPSTQTSTEPIKITTKPTEEATKPTKPTKAPVAPTSPSPLTNEVDASLKPTLEDKISSTTEKIGLVTWTSMIGPTTTESGIKNTTQDGWVPATPSWILLSTLSTSKENTSVPTMQPSHTIPPFKKPINATTKPESNSTTAMPPVTKPPISARPTEESQKENTTASEEFTTFMYVSDKTTEATLAANETKTNATTPMPMADNTTEIVRLNATSETDEALSTEKSTVSPIEGITSTGSPISSPDAVNMSDYTDVCGRRIWPEARIVGGARSTFGRWPWQISLRQWRTSTYLHKCGAALLNENWAITAAHCVDSVPPSDLLLRLGEHDLASEEEPYGFQERRVQIVASHPQFDPRTFEYDLALLRFYEPVTFQPNILPVCVPTDDEGFIGKTAYVTGWGRLYEDGPLPSVLQEVSVPVIENAVCENMYRNAGYIEHIPRIFICAGWKKGGFDSCEGDSGGPMVLQRPDKRFLLAGVISWGIGCAEPNQPGVYTRISQFRHWINQILQF